MKMDATAFVADPELVDALRQHSDSVACVEDRVLFNQGDAPNGLYIFLKGALRLVMRSQLGDVLMDMAANEGSLLGLPGLIGGTPYSLSAYAAKGSEVGFVSREQFANIMLSQPPIAVGILRVLAAQVRTARMALVER
jgi:CRP-like cAMP-binding protein